MRKNIKTTIIKEVILSEKEAELILKCLRYCKHRLTRHSESGIKYTINRDDLFILIQGLSLE